MKRRVRHLSLTADHVARIHKVIEDDGVAPAGFDRQTDADYAAWVERMLQSRPTPHGPVRLFAFGSLIWKPEFDHVAESIGVARGWHRSFCLHLTRFRGTPDNPGLMMALDRGGQCRGIVYELPPDGLEGQFDRLFRREFTYKPVTNTPRWIKVVTGDGPMEALAFVMNRASPLYVGGLAPDAVADVLARACGHWGTGSEYLLNTVKHLEERGIHDRNLWRLQRLVAERIDALDHLPNH